MAAVSYPPWGSAPSTLDGQDKTEKWWKNAKDALKKPWKWKKDKGKKSSPPACTPSTQLGAGRPFDRFPPIMSQLSSLYERRISDPEKRPSRRLYERGTEEATDFEPPEYKPPRPPLSNVFSMYDTPSVTEGKAGGGGAVRGEGGGGWRKEEGGGVRRQVPSNAASKQRHGNFNLEEEEKEGEEKEGESGRERRHTPSAESADSSDRSMERRQRRTGAVRDLPRLPKRSASFDRSDVRSHRSLPEAAIRRRRRPTPVPRDIVDFGIPPRHFARPNSPTEEITAHNFQIPPWQLQRDGLPPLSEEGDASADEIKGFDSFMMY